MSGRDSSAEARGECCRKRNLTLGVTMSREITSREKFFWNMMGSFANAALSLILSILVNRVLGGESGGIFSFAYSNALLMLTIGEFEVRQYQATDVRENYSFSTYRRLRILTCVLMLFCTIGYVLCNRGSLSQEECAMIFLLSAYKAIEAYADVYAGRFQQKDRIDLSGKLFFVRNAASMAIFAIVLWTTHNMVAAAASMGVISLLLFLFCDRRYAKQEKAMEGDTSSKLVLRLAREVMPLFLQAFSLMYVNNAPKYAINRSCDASVQNLYNILIMPTFSINLFSIFIFRPMLLNIAKAWNDGDLAEFRKIILKITGMILVLTGGILAGTWLLGTQLLELLYGLDLAAQRINLLAAMSVGGLCALAQFMYSVITAIRYHKYLIIGYAAAFFCALLAAPPLVSGFGIQGGIMSYALSMSVLCVAYLGIFFFAYGKKKQEK